jgi:UPF0755 protein
MEHYLSRPLRILSILLGILLVAALACAGALLVVSRGQPVDFVQTALVQLQLAGREDDLNRPVGTDDTPIRFTVEPGTAPRAIAQNLFNAGLISDQQLFVDYVRANDLDVQLEAGVFFLNKAQTIPQIAVSLTDSRLSQFPFRILEGWRIEEIADVIDRTTYFGFSGDDFLRVVGHGAEIDSNFAAYVGLPPGASLEGFLFPDTYQLPATVTPEMLRDILRDRFIEQVGVDLHAQAAEEGMSLFEVVTLASIIQREAVRADEHRRIASVYRNRLDVDMKLDADPTVQYGIGFENNTWWPAITQADYTGVDSPYNTYLNTGLPPGPIANPGISAIRAAIDPETTRYFYFRARCDGSGYHEFALTYEEHIANQC